MQFVKSSLGLASQMTSHKEDGEFLPNIFIVDNIYNMECKIIK